MHSQPTRFTLYSGPSSMFGAKAQIAALEKGWYSTSSWWLMTLNSATTPSTLRCCA
jgi:hypothetical protein